MSDIVVRSHFSTSSFLFWPQLVEQSSLGEDVWYDLVWHEVVMRCDKGSRAVPEVLWCCRVFVTWVNGVQECRMSILSRVQGGAKY